MNNYLEKIISEEFKSKKQQRYFFAKSQDKTLSPKERKKWKKMATEFSKDTDYKKIPEEIDEIVDENGEITKNKIPLAAKTKGVTQLRTTDEVMKTSHNTAGSLAAYGGTSNVRYWVEADLSKNLGFDETMGKNLDKDDAEEYFKNELKIDDPEERLEKMGYTDDVPEDKITLIENPKKLIEDYLDSIFKKDNELIRKDKKIPELIKKQLESLKDSIKRYDLDINDITKYLKK